MKILITAIVIMLTWVNGEATGMGIDISKIIAIESGFDSLKIGKAGEIGLCQITRECMTDFNIRNKRSFKYPTDLYNPRINIGMAQWYLGERIPQMLKAYNKPVTIENILISYNAGIRYVRDNIPTPKSTLRYINKYKRAEANIQKVKAYL